MRDKVRISVSVDRATELLLESHARVTGIEKSRLVEDALLHHLLARQELPADVIIHPRLVVTRESGERIAEKIRAPRPSRALRRLMRRGDR
jgi:hypothetical protein